MGRAGRRRVHEQLSWDHQVPALIAAFLRAFEKRGRG
jgi:hypothetical protein